MVFLNRKAADRTDSATHTIRGPTAGSKYRGPQVSSVKKNSGAKPATRAVRASTAKVVTRRSSRQALVSQTRGSSVTGQYTSRPLLVERKNEIAFRTDGIRGTVHWAIC